MNSCPICQSETEKNARFCAKCGQALARHPPQEGPPERILDGKYRLDALLGEGGMGKVFRATQLSLEKTVALKVLHRSLLSDERTVARFHREAKAASRLNHPNSISIIDFGQGSDGSLFIAMEYVAGKDLQQLLAAQGELGQKRLIRIFSQVLSALADAHAAGVIHRDLKPENIMVEQRRGEPDFVKVLDFGIAKIQQTSACQSLTRAGFVCGTPEYMSPEQGRGLPLDARSDLYAVGVVLYQCATGMLPFEGDSPLAVASMHSDVLPVPPRQKKTKARISGRMEALILRALEKNPDLRPSSAEDFRLELLALEKEEITLSECHGAAFPRLESDFSVYELEEIPTSRIDVPLGMFSGNSLKKNKRVLWGLVWGLFLSALGVGGYFFLSYRQAQSGLARSLPDQEMVAPIFSSTAPSVDESAANAVSDSAFAEEMAKSSPGFSPPKMVLDLSDKQGGKPMAGYSISATSATNDKNLALWISSYQKHPNAALAKRIAMIYLRKKDHSSAAKWLQRYMLIEKKADAQYIEKFLERHQGAR